MKKENKKPELSNSDIIYLIKFPSCVTRFFYFHLFLLKWPSYEKLAMTSLFDLTRFLTRFFNSGIPDPWKDCNDFDLEWKMKSYVSYDKTFVRIKDFLWHGTESD